MQTTLKQLSFSRRLHIHIALYLTKRKGDKYDLQGVALDSEGMDMEIDLSNLGTSNTMFAALFRDALRSFIQGYQEGLKEVMEKKEEAKPQDGAETPKKST